MTKKVAEMTDREAIVHVGFHKTGTTSIQQVLQKYDDGNTIYADLGDPNHSIFFQTLLTDNNLLEHWQRMGLRESEHEILVKNYWSTLEKVVEQPRSRVLFSGENISILPEDSLRRLKHFLGFHFNIISVIVFIREPLSWLTSHVQEHIKHGATLDREDIYRIDFADRLINLRSTFGEKNVKILYYEDAIRNLNNTSLVGYLMDELGLSRQNLEVNKSENQSLDETTVKIISKFNEAGVMHNQGQMLTVVRWKFIFLLDKIICEGKERVKLDPYIFRSKVNMDDIENLKKIIGNKYASFDDTTSSQKLLNYWNDIDYECVKTKLHTYLKGKDISVPPYLNLMQMVTMLFYHVMREDALDPIQKRLVQKEQEFNKLKRELAILQNQNIVNTSE